LYTGESNSVEIEPCSQFEQRATKKWNKRGLDTGHASRPYEVEHNTIFSIFLFDMGSTNRFVDLELPNQTSVCFLSACMFKSTLGMLLER